MTGAQVDSFVERLNRELQVLDDHDRNVLFDDIDRRDRQMRADGQERPMWLGPLPEADVLGMEVVIPTDRGDRCGRVICFGVLPDPEAPGSYERSVVVFVPSSGTCHEGPGSLARVAHRSDLERSSMELSMSAKLRTAAAIRPEQKTRARPTLDGVKDPELIRQLNEMAAASDAVALTDEKKGSTKIVGMNGRRMYIIRGIVRVDLSGFCFEHPAVHPLSADRAREMHLGSVRGQIKFEDRDLSLQAFAQALELLR